MIIPACKACHAAMMANPSPQGKGEGVWRELIVDGILHFRYQPANGRNRPFPCGLPLNADGRRIYD